MPPVTASTTANDVSAGRDFAGRDHVTVDIDNLPGIVYQKMIEMAREIGIIRAELTEVRKAVLTGNGTPSLVSRVEALEDCAKKRRGGGF